tara:strand:- start:820 stop:1224 length:405 start_codon:yes stop_codon:yes gene_type:complete
MLEGKSYFKIENGSERNFGIVFFFFFMIVVLYQLIFREEFNIWLTIIGLLFLLCGLLLPKVLYYPNKAWFILGKILGSIVSFFVMIFIFYLFFAPIGLVVRLFNPNYLNYKINKNLKTYWINRKDNVNSMKNQF